MGRMDTKAKSGLMISEEGERHMGLGKVTQSIPTVSDVYFFTTKIQSHMVSCQDLTNLGGRYIGIDCRTFQIIMYASGVSYKNHNTNRCLLKQRNEATHTCSRVHVDHGWVMNYSPMTSTQSIAHIVTKSEKCQTSALQCIIKKFMKTMQLISLNKYL